MDTKNFDNIVKTMMESAQEEVSPRVWDGVQNGLDAAAARHGRIIFLRRAAVALTAAAAAIVLLLTAGPLSDNSIQPTISKKAITLVPEKPAAAMVPDSGRVELQKPTEAPVRAALAKAVPEQITKAAEKQISEASVEQLAEAAPEQTTWNEPSKTTEEPPHAASKSAEPKDAGNAVKTFTEDGFAAMMLEDLAASRKPGRNIRLRIGANLADNGVRTSPYSTPVRRAQQGSHNYNVIRENGESNYKMPVSFGIGLEIPLNKRFSIGTGVTYTSLSRTFPGRYLKYDEATGASELLYGDAKHTVKYLGIPVNILYHFPLKGDFSIYTYGGGEIERSFLNKYRIALNSGKIKHRANNTGFQFSVHVGVGAEYKINNYLGIYFDPSVKYYFDGNQPKSIRTQHPWMINLEAGLRFNL